jgi:hypothetical protein
MFFDQAFEFAKRLQQGTSCDQEVANAFPIEVLPLRFHRAFQTHHPDAVTYSRCAYETVTGWLLTHGGRHGNKLVRESGTGQSF